MLNIYNFYVHSMTNPSVVFSVLEVESNKSKGAFTTSKISFINTITGLRKKDFSLSLNGQKNNSTNTDTWII